MTTASDWVEATRETLGGGITEQVNRLGEDYQPGDTSIKLQYELKGITAGVPISVGLNTFQVWSTVPSANEVEITPSWAGSPNVAALVGEIVRVKPNFYTHRILTALNDTLSEMSSPSMGMYGVGIQDLPYEEPQTVYDLIELEGVTGILRVQLGSVNDETEDWQEVRWSHEKLEPTQDFPSGHQLHIHPPSHDFWDRTGDILRVIYRRNFETLDSLNDNVTNTLLPTTAYDVPILGAAARLARPQEFRRNLLNAQPDSRRAEEVPPGASGSGAMMLRRLFEERVNQECGRLRADYPYKMQV